MLSLEWLIKDQSQTAAVSWAVLAIFHALNNSRALCCALVGALPSRLTHFLSSSCSLQTSSGSCVALGIHHWVSRASWRGHSQDFSIAFLPGAGFLAEGLQPSPEWHMSSSVQASPSRIHCGAPSRFLPA